MNKTPFNQLDEAGKNERLAFYKAEDARLGTTTVLGRIVKPAKINEIKNGAKQAIVRLAIYNKEAKKTDYFNVFAYIAPGKDALEAFYASLEKGQLVSTQYKENNGFKNVYNMMDRSKADHRKKKTTEVVIDPADVELTV